MIESDFDRFLRLLWPAEGVHSDDKHDSGGDTWYGISAAAHPGIPWETYSDDAKRARAKAIAYEDYWRKTGCEREAMRWPLNLVVADFAFNSGASRAVEALQRQVGAEPDGVFGDDTHGRVEHVCNTIGTTQLARNVHVARCRFLADAHQHGTIVKGDHDLETEEKYLEGLWIRTILVAFELG